MNYKKIREEFSAGASLKELAKNHSVSYSALLRRSKKENWTRYDRFSSLRQGIESLARLISLISVAAEETGKMEPRDIKYLTAAEKELFELTKEISAPPIKEGQKEEKLKELGSPVSGIIIIPEAE